MKTCFKTLSSCSEFHIIVDLFTPEFRCRSSPVVLAEESDPHLQVLGSNGNDARRSTAELPKLSTHGSK